MRRPPPRDLAHNRLWQGAGPRRALVYVLASVLVIGAGLVAVRMSMPEDPHARVQVERLPGAAEDGATTTNVRYDPSTGTTSVDVRQPDGVVRRYYLEQEGGDMRIRGGDLAPPD